jgi:hypothetical protein
VAASAAPEPPRRRARFLLPLGLFLLAVFLLVRVFQPKSAPPPVVPAYTPQQAATAQQHVAALREQFFHPMLVAPAPDTSEIPSPAAYRTRHAAPPRSAAVRLQLSQADLNTYLATNPQVVRVLRARGIKAVQILLHPPSGIDVRAAVIYRGHPANMEIAGTLQASAQTIVHLAATHAQVGRLPIPSRFVTKEAGKLIAQFTQRIRGRLPLQVQTVQVVRDNLVLTGVPLRQAKR